MPNTNHSVADAASCSRFVQLGVWAKWLVFWTTCVAGWNFLVGSWNRRGFQMASEWYVKFYGNFLEKCLVVVVSSISSPKSLFPHLHPPNTFITFQFLKSSTFHLQVWHSEQFCLSFAFPLMNERKLCREFWFSLASKGFICSPYNGTGPFVSRPHLAPSAVTLARAAMLSSCCQ